MGALTPVVRLVEYYLVLGPDAVPADTVLAEPGKPAPSLMLAPGQYRYAYEDEDS